MLLRFSITQNNKVRWLGWELYVGYLPHYGPRYYDVRFKGERIAYEISMQEAMACEEQHCGAVDGVVVLVCTLICCEPLKQSTMCCSYSSEPACKPAQVVFPHTHGSKYAESKCFLCVVLQHMAPLIFLRPTRCTLTVTGASVPQSGSWCRVLIVLSLQRTLMLLHSSRGLVSQTSTRMQSVSLSTTQVRGDGELLEESCGTRHMQASSAWIPAAHVYKL